MHTAVTILVLLLALVFGLWLAWCVFSALRSGVAEAAGGRKYRRRKQPGMYWFALACQALISLMFIHLVVQRFEELMK